MNFKFICTFATSAREKMFDFVDQQYWYFLFHLANIIVFAIACYLLFV